MTVPRSIRKLELTRGVSGTSESTFCRVLRQGSGALYSLVAVTSPVADPALAADWRAEHLGPATQAEKRLLAAVLPVQQSSTSSSKWDAARRVLEDYLGKRAGYVGGVGIQNAVWWRKHRHNRSRQLGFTV